MTIFVNPEDYTKHPLQHSWTLYFDNPALKVSRAVPCWLVHATVLTMRFGCTHTLGLNAYQAVRLPLPVRAAGAGAPIRPLSHANVPVGRGITVERAALTQHAPFYFGASCAA